MNRRLAVDVAACVLLLVQFLLGMVVNLGVVLNPARVETAGGRGLVPIWFNQHPAV
jgi:hypothetical protein